MPAEVGGELTEAECAALETPVEPGTLAGLVLRGREPLTAGNVWLRRGQRIAPTDPRAPWAGIPSALPMAESGLPRRIPIDAQGRFVFSGVARDQHTFAVELGGRTIAQEVHALDANERLRRARPGHGRGRRSRLRRPGALHRGARVTADRFVRRNGEPRRFQYAVTDDARRRVRAGSPAGRRVPRRRASRPARARSVAGAGRRSAARARSG